MENAQHFLTYKRRVGVPAERVLRERRACVPFSGKLRKTIGGYVGFPGFYEIMGEKVRDEKANILEMGC